MPPDVRFAVYGGAGLDMFFGDWNSYYSKGYEFSAGIKFSVPSDIIYIHTEFQYSSHHQKEVFPELVDDNQGYIFTDINLLSINSGVSINLPIKSSVIPFFRIDIGTVRTSSDNTTNIDNRWTSNFTFGGGVEVFPGTDKFSISLYSTVNLIPLRINLPGGESGLFTRYAVKGVVNYYIY